MSEEINKIGDKAAGSSYAASLGSLAPMQTNVGQEAAAPSESKGIDQVDKASVSKPDKTDEAAGANNLDAFKGSMTENQGFPPGMQNQSSISGTGQVNGIDPGMQPAGVFKSGKDYE